MNNLDFRTAARTESGCEKKAACTVTGNTTIKEFRVSSTCSGRNPKLGGALTQAHIVNNYWLDTSYFCITVEDGAQARVESNYFEDASKPHWLQSGAIAIDSGNVYAGTSSSNTKDTGGNVFSVPYAYTKESAATARSSIINCAGPQQIQ